MNKFARAGPRGLPIATPSICLYVMLLKLNSTEVVAVFISSIKTCREVSGITG